jgi:hypothetical protein
MTFANGVATFTLKHNQTKTATGLPADISYEVVESSAAGYTATYSGKTGTIHAGVKASASVSNNYSATGTVNFTAEKVFKNGNLGEHPFTFKLTQVTGEGSTTQASTNVKLSATETQTTDATSGTTDTVTFNTITFTKNSTVDETGDYWFLLEEDVPDGVDANGVKDGIKYDRTQKWINVTVVDAGNGTLTVTKDPASAMASTAPGPTNSWAPSRSPKPSPALPACPMVSRSPQPGRKMALTRRGS